MRAFVIVGGTSEPGGLHVHSAELAAALAQAGHPVTIVCPSIDYFTALLQDTSVQVVCCDPPSRRFELGAITAWREIFAPLSPVVNPDLPETTAILCRGQAGQHSVALMRALRHSFTNVFAIEHRVPDPSARLLVRLQSLLGLTQADRSIAVSEAVREKMISSLGFTEDNVVTCPNWVDPVAFSPDTDERQAFRVAHGIEKHTQVIGFIGRFAPEKRVDVLIEGFAALASESDQSLRLVLCGGGWKEQELRALVARLDLTAKVTFAGWQDNPVAWYRAFEYFVLPSELEGMPVVLLEAMASGCACLVHPFDAAPECIESSYSGVIASLHSPEDVTQALDHLVKQGENHRRELGQRARETVLARFTASQRMPSLLRALDAEFAATDYERRTSDTALALPKRSWQVSLN